jgi:hypothetical protein
MRIATAPTSARSILIDPGQGSREHRSAWAPSDPHGGIVVFDLQVGSPYGDRSPLIP